MHCRFVKDGALTALVVNSAKRSAALPEVPTTAEAGFIDAEYPFWIGMFLPAKTPRAIVDKLHGEVAKALATPAVRSRLEALGVDPMTMSSGEMDTFVRKQIAADAALAKAAGSNRNDQVSDRLTMARRGTRKAMMRACNTFALRTETPTSGG